MRSQLIPVSLSPVPTYDHHRYVRVTADSPATTVIVKSARDQTPLIGPDNKPVDVLRKLITNPTRKNWMVSRQTNEIYSPILGGKTMPKAW